MTDLPLTRDVEGYLLGRGVKPETIRGMGLRTWLPAAIDDPAPDREFARMYGRRGERLEGRLATPLRAPRGTLLGVEFRGVSKKEFNQFLLPASRWNPVMIGLRPAMSKLWAGGAAWVCEGLFDLAALEWIVPPGDAVVATIRARLSDSHAELFRRLRVEVKLVYDNDPTGRAATQKAQAKLTALGVPSSDVRYHGGKDPGVIWDAGGLPAITRAFAGST